MTDATARQLANILVDLFDRHGFDCIGTFNLREFSPEAEFNEDKDDYKYRDTETGFEDLRRLAFYEGEGRYALGQIVATALRYFERATVLPLRYREMMAATSERPTAPLRVTGLNDEQVGLEERIRNRDSQQLIQLLTYVQENMKAPDEQFFAGLNQFN